MIFARKKKYVFFIIFQHQKQTIVVHTTFLWLIENRKKNLDSFSRKDKKSLMYANSLQKLINNKSQTAPYRTRCWLFFLLLFLCTESNKTNEINVSTPIPHFRFIVEQISVLNEIICENRKEIIKCHLQMMPITKLEMYKYWYIDIYY